MDCDGLKKSLIRDVDGSFLGHKGTVLPNSAYQWGGDQLHGLGDNRIPAALTFGEFQKNKTVNDFAPHKGENIKILHFTQFCHFY